MGWCEMALDLAPVFANPAASNVNFADNRLISALRRCNVTTSEFQ
jgi:hypothetical protein